MPSIVPRASATVANELASERAGCNARRERNSTDGAGRPAPRVQRGWYRRGARSARSRVDRAETGEDANSRDRVAAADRAYPQAHEPDVRGADIAPVVH